MGRRAIETDNRRVYRAIGKLHADTLSKQHPEIASIIRRTIAQQLPRKLSCEPLLCILQKCPVISLPAAAEATDYRYACSTTREYAALARVAAKAIEAYMDR